MSKLVVDSIQKSGGAIFNLPTSDGSTGQYLATDGSGNLSWTQPEILNGVPPDDTPLLVGSVMSSSARGNIYSTGEWTTDGPNGNWDGTQGAGGDAAMTHMSFNMFLGDGYPNGTTQNMYSGDFRGLEYRTILYSSNDRLGHNNRELFYYENNTSYGGATWHIMPVRNTTGSPITRTLNFRYSSYSTNLGASLGVYTPNSAVYSGTTGGNWSQLFSNASNTISQSTSDIVVPANTTVLVMLVTSQNYQTTYYFKEATMFYGLSTFFDGDLVCDQRMLHALATLRTPAATNTTSYPEKIYEGCASVYGDR